MFVQEEISLQIKSCHRQFRWLDNWPICQVKATKWSRLEKNWICLL